MGDISTRNIFFGVWSYLRASVRKSQRNLKTMHSVPWCDARAFSRIKESRRIFPRDVAKEINVLHCIQKGVGISAIWTTCTYKTINISNPPKRSLGKKNRGLESDQFKGGISLFFQPNYISDARNGWKTSKTTNVFLLIASSINSTNNAIVQAKWNKELTKPTAFSQSREL